MTTEKSFTGYEVAKLANEKLTEAGLKNIPPQMVYNYMRLNKKNGKALMASIKVGEQRKVTEKVANEFISKLVDRRASKEVEKAEEVNS